MSASVLVTGDKRLRAPTHRFPVDSWLRLPDRPGPLRTLVHREEKYDLIATLVAVHGTMAAVTVANRSVRIALVARRHIDLKRVCSCCCLP
jgi:hypothetical protein